MRLGHTTRRERGERGKRTGFYWRKRTGKKKRVEPAGRLGNMVSDRIVGVDPSGARARTGVNENTGDPAAHAVQPPKRRVVRALPGSIAAAQRSRPTKWPIAVPPGVRRRYDLNIVFQTCKSETVRATWKIRKTDSYTRSGRKTTGNF